jgi:hypothetical protein
MKSKLYDQFRALLPVLVGLYVPTLILLAAAVAISIQADIPISRFTRDPAAILGRNPFIGVLSNIGVLLWAFCAGVCFFASAVLRARAERQEWPAFFLFAGLITAVLLMDDLFLLHEKYIPRYLHFGERIIFPLYAVMLLGYLIRFRNNLARTNYLLLLLALGMFGLSLAVDRLAETMLPWHHLFEDGFKLLGIVGWFGYFVTSAYRVVTSAAMADRP